MTAMGVVLFWILTMQQQDRPRDLVAFGACKLINCTIQFDRQPRTPECAAVDSTSGAPLTVIVGRNRLRITGTNGTGGRGGAGAGRGDIIYWSCRVHLRRDYSLDTRR